MEPKLNSTKNQNKVEMPQALDALDKMKYEIAKEMGINVPMRGNSYDWRMVPSYYCGQIGGEIVKRSMQFVEAMVSQDSQAISKVLSSVEDNEPIVQDWHEEPTPYEGPTKPINSKYSMPTHTSENTIKH